MKHEPRSVYEPPVCHVKGYEIHTALMDYHVASKKPVAGRTPKYKPVFECAIRKELLREDEK